MTSVLVTGATGLVGTHLVERLSQRGDAVRALCRPTSDPSNLEALDIEIVTGDLGDPARLRKAARGARVVYHCAARPPLGGTAQDFFRDNAVGTENLLRACCDEGVGRFIHTSTVDVYGYLHHDGTSEEAPFLSDGPYSNSKIEAERLVRRYCEQQGLPFTILRPCLIYGHFDRHLLPAVLTLLRLNWSPLIDGGRKLHDLVYAGDVAEAMILAADRPAAAGKTYNITDGRRRALREILELCADVIGKEARFLNVPYPLAHGAARSLDLIGRLLRFQIPDYCRWEVVKAMAHDRHFDGAKAACELGFRPRMSLEEGLRLSWEWYRDKRPRIRVERATQQTGG